MTAKERVRELLERLPDDCTLEDIQYHFYVLQKIERGVQELHNGRALSSDEAEQYFSKWFDQLLRNERQS